MTPPTANSIHRPPRACPVCQHDLVVTGLGCLDCGTALSGVFTQCSYCGLDDLDLETLRVFLVSRGNMRELATHLGVSYPTARQRYSDLLERLGLDVPEPVERTKVLEDLAAGRVSIDEAEVLLGNEL